MTLRKVIILIFCTMMLTISITSCAIITDSAYKDSGEGPLMIYIYEGNQYIKHHINSYNALHDETQIEYEAFSSGYLGQMYHKLKKGIDNLNGPDLILIDNHFLRDNDLYQCIEDGMFADMDKLMERQHFNTSLYNMKVLDAGIIDDTRVIMPMVYSYKAAVALKQSFDNLGISLPDDLNMESLMNILHTYFECVPQGNSPLYCMVLESSLSSFLNEEYQFDDSKQVYEFIEVCKKINTIMFDSTFYDECQEEGFDYYDWYLENNVLFDYTGGRLSRLYYDYNMIKNKHGSDIVIYNYPLGTKIQNTSPCLSLAISASSDKKNKAFKFIKYMLSEDVQSDKEYGFGVPVNLDSYEAKKDKLINGDYDFFNYTDFTPTPVPTELVFQLLDIIENSECELGKYEYIYSHCIGIPMGKYLQGSMQLEDVVDEINDNLYRYFNDKED